MGTRRVIHAITPGDHFSPLTGSAVPTVVRLLAEAAALNGDLTHGVLLDRTTMSPRYGGAELIEYDPAPGVSRSGRYLDAVAGRAGLIRPGAARWFGPLAQAARTLPPADILAHNAPLLPLLLRGSGHRVSLYAHNRLFRSYGRREADRVAGEAASLICVSEALAEDMRAVLPRSAASKLRVVENPVDAERFTPRSAGGPVRTGPPRILFVGRMIPQKGAAVLVAAAAEFAPDEAEFVLVGSQGFDAGSALSGYERRLRRDAGRCRSVVRFLPFTDRRGLPDLYRDADILVMPSRGAEASGLTLGEGMATGLPIVASDLGGIPSVVGEVGVLVPPNDPHALARALRELIADGARRRRLGEAGRERALQRSPAWAWAQLRAALDAL